MKNLKREIYEKRSKKRLYNIFLYPEDWLSDVNQLFKDVKLINYETNEIFQFTEDDANAIYVSILSKKIIRKLNILFHVDEIVHVLWYPYQLGPCCRNAIWNPIQYSTAPKIYHESEYKCDICGDSYQKQKFIDIASKNKTITFDEACNQLGFQTNKRCCRESLIHCSDEAVNEQVNELLSRDENARNEYLRTKKTYRSYYAV